ncbi:hypothetical protein SERLA73DRAFT_190120 [Serpula lacrymans var. lacrymans S7.3]|uniref:Uncharacterized protein n=2 Tax=Serpula lacrymans var. lacrymans TaxID=341189 RepID=F8QF38_SERL3|nr:uncharacterized protein SERLADRAFT_461951 [Serpula lacrymans var. lacrymans S7.9]EGN92997.1 hypothetical protein SERLA73DRAFT_190120 [Serpula lacrymans var. lacrymans S7.3]EGO27831.1 hypothetical protein SERLADRAFT_461951 [Serpula lacrymans var. lacrymans S7.9]
MTPGRDVVKIWAIIPAEQTSSPIKTYRGTGHKPRLVYDHINWDPGLLNRTLVADAAAWWECGGCNLAENVKKRRYENLDDQSLCSARPRDQCFPGSDSLNLTRTFCNS